MSWYLANGLLKVQEERMIATKELLKEIECSVPFPKKLFVDLVKQLAGKGNDAREKSDTNKHNLAERGKKMKKLALKVELLAENSQLVARLQLKVADCDVKLVTIRVVVLGSTKAL